jgi:hypothetical protein
MNPHMPEESPYWLSLPVLRIDETRVEQQRIELLTIHRMI